MNGAVVRTRDGHIVPGGLRPVTEDQLHFGQPLQAVCLPGDRPDVMVQVGRFQQFGLREVEIAHPLPSGRACGVSRDLGGISTAPTAR